MPPIGKVVAVEIPGWVRELRNSPTAWQDFCQWLASDLQRASAVHRSAPSWEAVQKARGRLETLEALDRWRAAAEEEANERPTRIRTA